MPVSWIVCLALFFSFLSPPSHPANSPLTLESSFRLSPDVTGHFDHLAIDLRGHRLFVTPEAYKSVLVLDYTTGKTIHKIVGIGVPHAVLYRADLNRIYVTDGDPGELKIFDGKSYRLIKSIKLQAHTDSIAYDPGSKYLYAISGGKEANEAKSTIYIVNTTSGMVVGKITLDSDALEAMALDTKRGRLYVNDTAKGRIDVISLKTRSVIARWPITLGHDNTSMALDEAHNRLFVGCRSGSLVVFDTTVGKELMSLPLTTGVDDMVFDSPMHRVYAACGGGGGAVEVYDEGANKKVIHIATIPSGPTGKTALLSRTLNRYFVAVPRHDNTDASILVYDIH